jgi:hypothetical protein
MRAHSSQGMSYLDATLTAIFLCGRGVFNQANKVEG